MKLAIHRNLHQIGGSRVESAIDEGRLVLHHIGNSNALATYTAIWSRVTSCSGW